jgi:hypothetical protein
MGRLFEWVGIDQIVSSVLAIQGAGVIMCYARTVDEKPRRTHNPDLVIRASFAS